MDKITFLTDDNEEVEFYVVADTRSCGVNYLLVSDSLDEDGEALILKDVSADSDTESEYVIVDDDTEFDAIAKLFQEDLDDIEIVE